MALGVRHIRRGANGSRSHSRFETRAEAKAAARKARRLDSKRAITQEEERYAR